MSEFMGLILGHYEAKAEVANAQPFRCQALSFPALTAAVDRDFSQGAQPFTA
jgi:hypothetical protein